MIRKNAMEWWIITLFLVLGCSTASSRGKLDGQSKARYLVEIANGAIQDGDPVGALQELAKAEREDSQLPEIYHSRALAYLARHDLPQAIASARKAVELKPDYAEANNTLGKLLADAGKVEEATKYLKIAANDPLYREAYKANTSLGMLKYKRGEILQAETYFDQAIVDASDRACIAYYYKGHIALQRSKFKEASDYYERSTRKFCAKFGEGYLALGIAQEKNQEFQLARKTFLEIQKLYPNTRLAEQAMGRMKGLP